MSRIEPPTQTGSYFQLGADNAITGRALYSGASAAGGYVLEILSPVYADNTHNAFIVQDAAGNKGSLIDVEHFGTSGTTAYSLGVNIHNYPGADAGFALHHYSNLFAGAYFDNTSNGPLIVLRNTQNPTNSPNTFGAGPLLSFWGYVGTTSYSDGVVTGTTNLQSSTAAFVNSDKGKAITVGGSVTTISSVTDASHVVLAGAVTNGSGVTFSFPQAANVAQQGYLLDNQFIAAQTTLPWTFTSGSQAVVALQVTQNNAAIGVKIDAAVSGASTSPALQITNNKLGEALKISQNNASGTYAINLVQTSPNSAIFVNMQAGAAGHYAIDVSGQDYGPRYATSANGGDTLTLQKNGTGTGRALVVTNKGTGLSLDVRSASASILTIDNAGKVTTLNGATVTMTGGAGTPEGAVTAPIGSVYLRTDGGAATSFYVKESGAGNTGWVAK